MDTVDAVKVTRSAESEEMERWCWERVLCSDPESLMRQASRSSETEDDNPLALQHRALDERRQRESLKNPTAAMLQIIKRMEQRERERLNMTWQQQLQQLTGKKKQQQQQQQQNVADLTPNPLTPAMEEVIEMRSKRVSFDYDIPITPDPSDSDEDDSDDSEFQPPNSYRTKKQPLMGENVKRLSHRSSPGKLDNSDMSVEFDDDGDDGEFGGLVLNESILKFLHDDGTSLAEQRQEFLKYEEAPAKTVKSRRVSHHHDLNEATTSSAFSSLPSTSKKRLKPTNNSNKRGEKWIVTEAAKTKAKSKKKSRKTELEALIKSQFDPQEPEDEEDGQRRTRASRNKRHAPSDKPASKRRRVDEEVPDETDEEVIVSRVVTPRSTPRPSPPSTPNPKPRTLHQHPQQPKKIPRKRNSATTRRMRARNDSANWDWGQVLLSNPEKIISKKRK